MGYASAEINLGAVSANLQELQRVTTSILMPVVKADAYGHGLIPVAETCVNQGSTHLGVASIYDALRLVRYGISATILAWLIPPKQALVRDAVDHGIELSVSSVDEMVMAAGAGAQRHARLHLKADTGMGRAGAEQAGWLRLVECAAKLQAGGSIEVVGVWSHLACSDLPSHPANRMQKTKFDQFIAAVESVGLEPELRHLAASSALLTDPETHYDLVRPGLALYGYSTAPSVQVRLTPAMTLRAPILLKKRLRSGSGVSYGHRDVLMKSTEVALVGAGYVDGVPVMARGVVAMVGGVRCQMLGRASMDQVILDVSGVKCAVGDEVVLFGPHAIGATEWARAAGTVPSHILTSVGPAVTRHYVVP